MEQEVKLYGRLNRRSYKVKRDQLDAAVPSLNLEQIEVQATRPTESGARVAVNVILRWPKEEGGEVEEIFLDALNEGESVLVMPGIRAKLEKRHVGWVGQAWWILLLILLALLIWFGVFYTLYSMA
ncbi:MAG: hypothetical protein H8E35_07570 [Ardenticatenia bacterium]|nr:hypothetical protein [Ardenticatenia bacterium]